MKKYLRIIAKFFIGIFAVIGFVLVLGYVAVRLHFTDTKGVIDQQTKQFMNTAITDEKVTYTTFPLSHTPEWLAFKQAIVRDKVVLEKVSKETGISPRILIAILVPEQMRLFHSNRALFKQVFEPLKMLGSQSQFSWGLFGIKDETARAVESNLRDRTSPFYLGLSSEHLLDFATSDIDQERFQRIINEDDHTYSYLYAALYVREIEAQWQKAGITIKDRVDILATLWNLGFLKSKPNANPQSGGAEIEINNATYSFGSLAKSFYDSDELIELFPK